MANRSYSLKDVLVRASFTIQIIEDVAIYKAQIFSSNGNIFGTNDKESELHLVVWKGLEDITSKFDDIIWRRFTQKTTGYEEDLSWGDKYKGKTSFILTRDDIDERAKIQAEVYAPINGERKLVAVDYINFIDVNDLQGSSTPPSNPKDGDIWLDTSVMPPKLMVWDDKLKQWVEVTVAGQDRRNLIRNSNFYKATFDFWESVNNPTLEIESLNAKKWARIKSVKNNNGLCGIKQKATNIVPKSHYSFQILAKAYTQSGIANNSNAIINIFSINENCEKTLVLEETWNIIEDIKIFSSTFITLTDTKELEVNISGDKQNQFDFMLTNIKLENYAIPTDWELAIEDIQDALNNKVGNTPEEVFNTLTDDGKMQGLYVDIDDKGRKNFYFNATYIKSGKLLGEFIEGKNLSVKNDNGESTLKIDSEGNVNIKARSLKMLVEDDSDEERYEDAASKDDIAWKIDIISTNGLVFKNGIMSTTLKAIVYKGKKDVTNELSASKFIWTRTSKDENSDNEWNNNHGKGVKQIDITANDVYQRATFTCEINDE